MIDKLLRFSQFLSVSPHHEVPNVFRTIVSWWKNACRLCCTLFFFGWLWNVTIVIYPDARGWRVDRVRRCIILASSWTKQTSLDERGILLNFSGIPPRRVPSAHIGAVCYFKLQCRLRVYIGDTLINTCRTRAICSKIQYEFFTDIRAPRKLAGIFVNQ